MYVVFRLEAPCKFEIIIIIGSIMCYRIQTYKINRIVCESIVITVATKTTTK